MIRKIWEALAGLRLTLWLLVSAAVLFLTGSFIAGNNFAFFKEMNEMPLQDWVLSRGIAFPAKTWWLGPLFIVLFLLGINAFACLTSRITTLWPRRKDMAVRKFVFLLTPSLVHILFVIIMLGHLATFTLGSWQRIEFREGAAFSLHHGGVEWTVTGMDRIYYPVDSLMKERLRQMSVNLKGSDGREVTVAFLDPVLIDGWLVFLDMKKIRREDVKQAPVIVSKDECNKEPVYRKIPREERKRETEILQIRAMRDPGLPVIVCGFFLMLSLLAWYNMEQKSRAGGDPGQDK